MEVEKRRCYGCSWVNMQSADLARANLTRALLNSANLQSAHLVRANLTEAALEWTNLRGANLT